MLSPGDGIALAGICALILAAILRRGSSNSRNACRTSDMCPEHSGIVANIETIKVDIEEIKTDIKTLIGRK